MEIDKGLTVEEVRKETLKLLQSNDESLVAHIGEEYLKQDLIVVTGDFGNETDLPPPVKYYGWDTAYVRFSDGRSGYTFHSGGNGSTPSTTLNDCCPGRNGRYSLYFDDYDHNNTNNSCGNYSIAEFVKK